MNLFDYKQYGPWILIKIHTNFGQKQSCGIEGCSQKSRSQFEIYSQPCGYTSYVCSYCASYLTRLDISRLSSVETYIVNIKNQFKDLKNLVGMSPVYNHPSQDLVGQLNSTIGAHRILISMYKNDKYKLKIDGQKIKADRYNTFRSKKQVTKRAIDYINSRNLDKLYYFIIN